MTKTETNKALRNINRLYEILGSWQEVANKIGVNRATVNKWFAGTRNMSLPYAEWIEYVLRWNDLKVQA